MRCCARQTLARVSAALLYIHRHLLLCLQLHLAAVPLLLQQWCWRRGVRWSVGAVAAAPQQLRQQQDEVRAAAEGNDNAQHLL